MKRVLIVVDYQKDFVAQDGALPVPNAENIAENIQARINNTVYENVIYTFDTHTKEQYFGSDEQKIFPDIHCEFNTPGWELFNIKPRNKIEFKKFIQNMNEPFNVYDIKDEIFFTKDQFDIWEGNSIYANWFEQRFPKGEYIFDVVGVATNYCVFMNIMGMIGRGYRVNIIENAVEGIKNFPDGNIDESFETNVNIMKNNNVNFI